MDEEAAKKLIMAARAHWFADGDKQGGRITWRRPASPNSRAS